MGLDPSFLSLLNVPVIVSPFLGEDTWGNTTYGAPFNTKMYQDPETETFGVDEGNNRQQNVRVVRSNFIADSLGIKLRDRLTLADATLLYVVEVATNKDEVGGDLFQNITAETTERG